jgi:hypothetical protein
MTKRNINMAQARRNETAAPYGLLANGLPAI